ncbi:hypothetical protein [Marinimicrobium alkaliphilum]|uniref:hypothetical protein n=1 Tax=Marinimicrobium alkaliphilum TaxID=2202654 RepID=UPI00130041C3|nr:hypothetical protein [Marinimicrobium alkaliphilum]
MTLILGAIAPNHAFHVSDRLVTRRRGVTYQPFDTHSNKTVVFRAKDAIVAIGYSGLAFIDGVPTDTWITNSLLGQREKEYASICSLADGSFKWSGINEALRRLKNDYEDAYRRFIRVEHKAGPQFFNIVGWMYDRRRRRHRPFHCEMVSDQSNPGRLKTYCGKHSWAWHRQLMLQTTPNIANEESKWAMENLAKKGLQSPSKFEKLLVEVIRRVSQSTTTVGSICTCVRICPFSDKQVLIRFADPKTEGLIFPASTGKKKVTIEAYTPYIIAPPTVWAPSYVHGGDGWTQEAFGYKFSWKLEGLEREKTPTQFFRGTQPRPHDPLNKRLK